jgi:hypothetical protein
MKAIGFSASTLCAVFVAAALQSGSAADPAKNPIVFGNPALDEVTLLGLGKEEALRRLGAPNKIYGAEEETQTYEFTTELQLSVVFRGGKLIEYIVRPECKAATDKGIHIGSYINAVTKMYGDFTREEEVPGWFTGDDALVLYHHGDSSRYKLIYPQANLIFLFDSEKGVEMIWVGVRPKP